MSDSEAEARVECIVKYLSPPGKNNGTKTFEITLNDSTPLSELFEKIEKFWELEQNTFQLTYQNKDGDKAFTRAEHTESTLKSIGLIPSPNRNLLMLEPFKGSNNKRVKSEDEEPELTPCPRQLSRFGQHNNEIAFPSRMQPTGFVGLVNQAMTCYLNSLLQALYMTPEFRNALYIWKFDRNTESKTCIPLQLQKLFLNLQTSTRTAVETTELTRSFGWSSGEVWQQQDIQELCRVMFDALENEFKDTEQADLINRLYQGKMTDYVKCLECGNEKWREDTFLDIPLPVRPFKSTVAYNSIIEALNAFVRPETLDGNNQYFCESCNKKCDAHKGLKFTKFPYLLTLHLKRFDFDYSTMNRIKLNDKVSFTEYLDLNDFIKSADESKPEIAEQAVDVKELSETTPTSEVASAISKMVINESDQDEDEGIDLSSNGVCNFDDKTFLENKHKGPFIYELYSIMIHSGSASGGHYYAYIKDFSKGEWYCFNDQTVTVITREDIEKTYGGGQARSYYSGAYSSSTNAYMLMYRQLDNEKNCTAMTEQNFPPHIKSTLEEIKQAEEQEKAIKARQEDMVKLKVFAFDPMDKGNLRDEKIHIYGYDKLSNATRLACSKFNLENTVPEDQCRLVLFNREKDQIEKSLEEDEDKPLNQILKSKPPNIDFFLECRETNKPFMTYAPDDIQMVVHVLSSDKGDILSTHHVRTSPNQDYSELRKFFHKALCLETLNFYIVVANPKIYLLNEEFKLKNTLTAMADNNVSRDSCNYQFTNRAFRYFICPSEGESLTNFENSSLYKTVEKLQNVISLEFIIPPICEVNKKLRSLFIPSLEDEKNSDNEINTPITENQPSNQLVNGCAEEEIVFSSTSDQSTSEDSSLTDSERTIIGEQNDYQLSSGSDSEQFSSADTSNKNQDTKSEGHQNSEDTTSKNYYFMASSLPMDAEQNRRLKVIVDINMPITMLQSKLESQLESFVGVSSKYLKLTKGSDLDNSANTVLKLWDLKDNDKVTISLYRVLNADEFKAKIYKLSLNDSVKVEFLFDWVIKVGMTVSYVKKAMVEELERRNIEYIKLSSERVRLRKKEYRRVGSILLDNELFNDSFLESHTVEMFVQILDKPEQIGENHRVIFAQRWHTSTNNLGQLVEVVLETPLTMSNFKHKLTDMSSIPLENILIAKGKLGFQDEVQPYLLSKLNWASEDELSEEGDVPYLPEDDTIVFFRDKTEEMKKLSKDEETTAFYEHNRDNNRVSYLSRKEKALKIHWSQSSRPPRNAIDVD